MSEDNMALIAKGLSLLPEGLLPYIDQEMRVAFGISWKAEVEDSWRAEYGDKRLKWQDPHAVLWTMSKYWNKVFMKSLGHEGRTWVHELRTVRNKWAHMEDFDDRETYRALDTIHSLLEPVGAPEASEARRLREEALDRLSSGGRGKEPVPEVGAPTVKTPTSTAVTPGGYEITKCQLGYKAKLYVVDITVEMVGYKVRYYGRFRSDGTFKLEKEFTVKPEPPDAEELREKALGFIKDNWRGPDEVKVRILGDKRYRITIGQKDEYDVTSRIAYNKAGKILSFDFKRPQDEAMVPFGDIIAAMYSKIMAQ